MERLNPDTPHTTFVRGGGGCTTDVRQQGLCVMHQVQHGFTVSGTPVTAVEP